MWEHINVLDVKRITYRRIGQRLALVVAHGHIELVQIVMVVRRKSWPLGTRLVLPVMQQVKYRYRDWCFWYLALALLNP